MTREKDKAKRLIWFCLCCSCSYKHLSGMRKILKIRDTAHINVFKVFFFLILSTPTGTLGIFAREQYFELLAAVIFEKGILLRGWAIWNSSYIPVT